MAGISEYYGHDGTTPPGHLQYRDARIRRAGRIYSYSDLPADAHPAIHSEARLACTELDFNGRQTLQSGADDGHKLLDESASATHRKGPNEPTFLISQASERELTFQLGLKAFAGMVGGPVATLAGFGWWLVTLAGMRGGL